MTDNAWGETLFFFRVQQGMGVIDTSRKSRLHVSIIKRIENGKLPNPTPATVKRITDGLGISTDEFEKIRLRIMEMQMADDQSWARAEEEYRQRRARRDAVRRDSPSVFRRPKR